VNYPEESIQHSEHGESLKSRKIMLPAPLSYGHISGKDMQCAVTELCADGEMPPSDIHTQLQRAYGDDSMEPTVSDSDKQL
jgi:hypothetical protein